MGTHTMEPHTGLNYGDTHWVEHTGLTMEPIELWEHTLG